MGHKPSTVPVATIAVVLVMLLIAAMCLLIPVLGAALWLFEARPMPVSSPPPVAPRIELVPNPDPPPQSPE